MVIQWTSRQTNLRAEGQADGQLMEGSKDRQTNGLTDRHMDELIDGWMDRRTDRQTDQWTDQLAH